MNEFLMKMAKRLHMRFSAIYEDRFYRNHKDDESITIWCEEWSLGLQGIDPNHIRPAIDYCRANLKWPPSIAEFREICDKCSGALDAKTIMDLAIRRDFTNPIVERIFKIIGSWDFQHDKEKDLLAKVQAARQDYLRTSDNLIEESNEVRKNLTQLEDIVRSNGCLG